MTMIISKTNTTVNGKEYKVWSDYIARGTFAENEDGEIKQISYSGYISKDLTIRKAIANAWNLNSFRR